ncbi:hypothetical protein RHSIM_Rhsim03G0230500 [Rhododendron simsii]|uniref:Nuclear transcription factor Y subunit n=1 Tax=Rhododendron simsii TaxID=118357 RepID=A0A834HAD8_RHOSS|nr:hypothetical protein RHSIM_Rhsim03G0230500 [Rhododendron simsii]
MAIRVQNFPTEIFEQNPNYPMSHFAINCPSWWNLHEQLLPQSSSMHFSLKVESPSELPLKAKHFGLQRKDQDSSSTQSSDLSHHEVLTMTGTNSQDQCISSEPAQESEGKHVESRMKPFFLRGHQDFATSPSQIDPSLSIGCNIPSRIDPTQSINHILYPFADVYSGGLFTAYGPPAVIQQQMIGMTPAKVPLPLDLAEDGPIYVNPKQYHAILRRRQMRAKLEAQNKIAKSRKPYLHESRHLHALNRVRGSGGRFLRTKSDQKLDPNPTTDTHGIPRSLPSSQHVVDLPKLEPETGKCGAMSIPSCSGITSVTNSDVIFWQPDRGFSATSHGSWHCAPVVR